MARRQQKKNKRLTEQKVAKKTSKASFSDFASKLRAAVGNHLKDSSPTSKNTPADKSQHKKSAWTKRETETQVQLSVPRHKRDSRDVSSISGIKTDESTLQVTDNPSADVRRLVIGFDLGTSSCKVVFHDVGTGNKYAVDFDDLAIAELPFLLPTQVTLEPNSTFRLVGNGVIFDDIKTGVMKDPNQVLASSNNAVSLTSFEVTVAFIALTLRESRFRFLDQHQGLYQDNWLKWEFNLGVASADFRALAPTHLFRKIALAAWSVSAIRGPISIDGVRIAIKLAESRLEELAERSSFTLQSNELHPELVQILPEVIAEVLGFAKSRHRQDGLYLLVDIGARTVDIATFRIHEHDHEDVYPVLECRVIPFGVNSLHIHRLEKIKTAVESQLSVLHARESHLPIPSLKELCGSVIPRHDGRQLGAVNEVFSDEVGKNIVEVLRVTKAKRNPKPEDWNELPIFLCGGGSSLDIYIDVLGTLQQPYRKIHLPKPVDMYPEALSPIDYQRLAVAYGLSTPYIEIGKIVPPDQLDDIVRQKPTTHYTDRYPSKDTI